MSPDFYAFGKRKKLLRFSDLLFADECARMGNAVEKETAKVKKRRKSGDFSGLVDWRLL